MIRGKPHNLSPVFSITKYLLSSYAGPGTESALGVNKDQTLQVPVHEGHTCCSRCCHKQLPPEADSPPTSGLGLLQASQGGMTETHEYSQELYGTLAGCSAKDNHGAKLRLAPSALWLRCPQPTTL